MGLALHNYHSFRGHFPQGWKPTAPSRAQQLQERGGLLGP
jgi:hypothetical protein